ncbi:MAG: hypothetical protein AAFV51_14235 [Pseudomonadota bacterium]
MADRLARRAPVRERLGRAADLQADRGASPLPRLADGLDDFLQGGRDIEPGGRDPELAGGDLRHVQHVVDELQEPPAARQDVVEIVPVAWIAEGPEGFGLDELGEAVNGVQRCTEFVAHIGEKLRTGPAGEVGAMLRLREGRRDAVDLALLIAQGLVAPLHRGDVGHERDRSAVAGALAADLQPAAVGGAGVRARLLARAEGADEGAERVRRGLERCQSLEAGVAGDEIALRGPHGGGLGGAVEERSKTYRIVR